MAKKRQNNYFLSLEAIEAVMREQLAEDTELRNLIWPIACTNDYDRVIKFVIGNFEHDKSDIISCAIQGEFELFRNKAFIKANSECLKTKAKKAFENLITENEESLKKLWDKLKWQEPSLKIKIGKSINGFLKEYQCELNSKQKRISKKPGSWVRFVLTNSEEPRPTKKEWEAKVYSSSHLDISHIAEVITKALINGEIKVCVGRGEEISPSDMQHLLNKSPWTAPDKRIFAQYVRGFFIKTAIEAMRIQPSGTALSFDITADYNQLLQNSIKGNEDDKKSIMSGLKASAKEFIQYHNEWKKHLSRSESERT